MRRKYNNDKTKIWPLPTVNPSVLTYVAAQFMHSSYRALDQFTVGSSISVMWLSIFFFKKMELFCLCMYVYMCVFSLLLMRMMIWVTPSVLISIKCSFVWPAKPASNSPYVLLKKSYFMTRCLYAYIYYLASWNNQYCNIGLWCTSNHQWQIILMTFFWEKSLDF